ncbi:PIN domain-containing protein [Pseudoalteromonas phenolica]|uniref:PIN domain-containing protein n=1 Tax=Pseudoalteromonas phenolica TaxID=161398 RepID=UPI00385049E6
MLEELLRQYGKQGVLLDTNLLVMYLIGTYDKSLVPKFKRTSMYTVEDFEWLESYVSRFSKIIVTPQVMAETWNFVEKLGKEIDQFLDKVLPTLFLFDEEYISKETVLSANGFNYVGVTDMSVIQAGVSLSCLVITDDFRAYSHFCQFSVPTININHLREVA